MKLKILVIGLDAATMDLVKPWAGAGILPSLARLMSEGSHSTLRSTPNMHSASAWTSILTGLNPGRHGLFVFSDRDFATGRQVFFNGGDRTGELITSYLARNGMSSGLLNVPMTYPARHGADGGFTISGLDAPAINDKAFSPVELRDELLARFPGYNFTPRGLGDLMTSGRLDEAASAWLSLTEIQTAAAEYLLAAHPVDFFMTVFTASDWAGHNLWNRLEPDHQERRGNSLRDVYRALDESIGRLLSFTDEQTQVYVISDHGMGPHTGAAYHLVDRLQETGLMSRDARRNPSTSLIKAARDAARKILPPGVRERIRRRVGDERVKRLLSSEKDAFYESVDWSRTAAYAEPGRHVVNVNLKGRNAEGIVASADYDRVCERVGRSLSEWTDSRGVPVVEKVVRRDEVYEGPFTDRASDLYIRWNSEARLGDPPEEVRARGFWWSGDHRPDGVLICKGPGIRAGASLKSPIVYDLLATIIYLAGLPVPVGLDGRVIEEMCEASFLADHPMRFTPSEQVDETNGSRLSDSEEEMVEEKLRSLGYL